MKTLVLVLLLLTGVFTAPVEVYSQRNRQVREIKTYTLRGDGRTDDTEALLAWSRGERVIYQGRVLGNVLQNGTFLINWKIKLARPNSTVRWNTFVMKDGVSYDKYTVSFDWKVRHHGNYITSEARWHRLPSIFRRYNIIQID